MTDDSVKKHFKIVGDSCPPWVTPWLLCKAACYGHLTSPPSGAGSSTATGCGSSLEPFHIPPGYIDSDTCLGNHRLCTGRGRWNQGPPTSWQWAVLIFFLKGGGPCSSTCANIIQNVVKLNGKYNKRLIILGITFHRTSTSLIIRD